MSKDIEWPGQEFLCACCTESLRVMRTDGEWSFGIWHATGYGQPYRQWRQRLRMVWRLLREGTPYGDHVILRDGDASRLGRLLSPSIWTNGTTTSTTGGSVTYSAGGTA